eukprot:TRINITY_DN1974_c0_g1_i1.p2 TRINITY_DN1974_c0_g1~~TRINITY_DN1974_c0_g1_i1.p2  ORF type:complete len:231 (+),score=71.55 TRINITY_DN1974_c0_g1_i1:1813-2505(+)
MDDQRLDEILDSVLDDFEEADKQATVAPPPAAAPPLMSSVPGDGGEPDIQGMIEELQRTLGDSDVPPAELQEFKETIDQTLQMLQANAAQLQGGDAQLSEDQISMLAQQFERLNHNEDFQGMMQTVLKQLLSRNVLFEPMKAISQQYPEWIAANRHKLDSTDLERYKKQQQIVEEIVSVFETDSENFDRICDLMQQMQEYGQPPADILQAMAPGGVGDPTAAVPENCSVM